MGHNLSSISFYGLSTIKKRPSLIISPEEYNNGEDVIISFITSNIPDVLFFGDYKIVNWEGSGLPKPSIIKTKIATIKKSIIVKKIGRLHNSDIKEFSDVLIKSFSS